MLFRVCSTNSAKAVAFLHGDKFLVAGLGSVLRVYDCLDDSGHRSSRHDRQGRSFTAAGTGAEADAQQDVKSFLDVGPACSSGLVAEALFSPSTHICGITVSSQRSLIAAYGLGRLILYELGHHASRAGESCRAREGGGELCSAGVRATQSTSTPQSPQADIFSRTHHAHFLSRVCRYKCGQWILDVRIISSASAAVESDTRHSVSSRGLRGVFLLLGRADGAVELLSASRPARCLASWTCGDRSLLYSLAIDVPSDGRTSPLNRRCHYRKRRIDETAPHGGDCRTGWTEGDASEAPTEALLGRQSSAFLTVASGTVYSSIVLWRIPFPPRCHLAIPEPADRRNSRGQGHTRCSDGPAPADTPSAYNGVESGAQLDTSSCRDAGAAAVSPVQVLKGHRGVIFRVRFYLGGRLLCSASDDRELRLWWGDAAPPEAPDGAGREGFGPEGTANCGTAFTCMSVLRGHRSRVWDVALLDLFMNSETVSSSSTSGRGNAGTERTPGSDFGVAERRYLIVSAGEDSSCRIWSLRGECLYSLLGHAGRGVRAVCATEARTSGGLPLLASGGEDGDVKLWSLIESPSLVKILKSRFLSTDPCSSSPASSTISPCGAGTDRKVGLQTTRSSESREASLALDTAPSADYTDFALTWDCRDYGRPDDFVREVRLLSADCGLVATNFGCVYLLLLTELSACADEGSAAGEASQSMQAAGAGEDSLAAHRKSKPALRVVCTALVRSPVVLTSLRVVDSLVTCGCADGTFFFFLLDREAAQSKRVWTRYRGAKAVISDPPRWQCFHQARVGNLFQLSLPSTESEHLYLQSAGPLGGLHAIARNSMATRSFWTEVDLSNSSASEYKAGLRLRGAKASAESPRLFGKCSSQEQGGPATGGQATSGAVECGTEEGPPFSAERSTGYCGQQSLVAATSHTGLVSLWYAAAGQEFSRPADHPRVLGDSQNLTKVRHTWEDSAGPQGVKAVHGCAEVLEETGDTAEGQRGSLEAELRSFARVVGTLQLPPAAQRKGDSTRCFSCLPLVRILRGSSSDRGGDSQDHKRAEGGPAVVNQALAIALLFGDEAGSLHVTQILVPELSVSDKGAQVTPGGPCVGEGSGGPSGRWDWANAKSAVAQTVEAAHRGQKVWDLSAQGNLVLSCGGDGTILLLVIRNPLSDVSLSGRDADAPPAQREHTDSAFSFAPTICPISSVRVPQLSFMYSLVPAEEAASPWWLSTEQLQGNASAAPSSDRADPLKHHWLCAFRMADFILFDLATSMQLMRVRCGNSRRPLDFSREGSRCYTFSSATKSRVFFYAERPDMQPGSFTNTPSGNSPPALEEGVGESYSRSSEPARPGPARWKTGPASGECGSGVDKAVSVVADAEKPYEGFLSDSVKSASFNPGFHGREVLAVTWLDEETICTGGEDNAVKVIQVSARRRAQLSERVCRGRGVRASQENAELSRCFDKHAQCRYQLRVQQTAVHHAGAVRCLRVLPAVGLNGEVVPRILVSCGACDLISLYAVNPSVKPGVLKDPDRQGHLRLRHLQTVRFSERGLGQDVRLNGIDGFVVPSSQIPSPADGSLCVHLWAASSSAEVYHVEGCIEGSGAEQWRSGSGASSLRKQATLELEAAALCISVLVLNDVRTIDKPEQLVNNSGRLNVLILLGLTTGRIAVVAEDADGCLRRTGTLYAHQCGTNDIRVQALPSLAREPHESAYSCGSRAGQGQSTNTYCVASCGDDQSITVQFIQLETDPDSGGWVRSVRVLSAVQCQNAHSSSVRACGLVYPLLFTVGWDRWLQVWEISWPPTGYPGDATALACRAGDRIACSRDCTSPVRDSTACYRDCKSPVGLPTTERAWELNRRTPSEQQRRFWGDCADRVVLRRVDAAKTSVSDVASLDVLATSHIKLCTTGSSGGLECFILSPS